MGYISIQINKAEGSADTGASDHMNADSIRTHFNYELVQFPDGVTDRTRAISQHFYSPEFNRKFRDESAAFSFEENKNREGHYHICVNDIPLVQWFRQKANEWRNSLWLFLQDKIKG